MATLQITIDDGPEPVETALTPILAEIRNRQVRAAFFLIGNEVQARPGAARDILAEHTLGNHSWDHLPNQDPRHCYTASVYRTNFQQAHDAIRTATETSVRHWRAPRGECRAAIQAALTTGANPLYTLSHCDWHCDSGDSQGATTAASMLQNIRQGFVTYPGRAMYRLLFHVLVHTATALPTVLTTLANEGHTYMDFSQAS